MLKFKFETKDIINSGRLNNNEVKALRFWIDSLGATDVPDQMLVLALLACNKNHEDAKNTLKSYFVCKNSTPELFDDCDIDAEDIQASLNTLSIAIPPKRDPKNYAVIFQELHDPSYHKFNTLSHLRRAGMVVDMLTNNEDPPDGFICVFDLRKFSFTLLPKLHLGYLMKLLHYAQDGMLIKIQQVHLMNSGYVLKSLISMLKFCLRGDLFQKIVCHQSGINNEEFYEKYIPANCIPCDYGGFQPSLKELHEKTVESLRDMKQWRIDEQKIREKYKDIFNNNNSTRTS